MTMHVLEKLAATNPECEIWWDSSPLVYAGWKASVLRNAPAGKSSEWRDQLTRLFDETEVRNSGQMGFRGVTTNPPLSLQAIQADPAFWADEIRKIALGHDADDIEGIYWEIYLDVVRRGAAMISKAYEVSGGKYGFVSGQVDPRFVTDGERMLRQGLELAAIAPNVMVKIPGSMEGYQVIEELTARGISTNNTTSFTVPQYVACMDAVSRGLARAKAIRLSTAPSWHSVSGFSSSHSVRAAAATMLLARAKPRFSCERINSTWG